MGRPNRLETIEITDSPEMDFALQRFKFNLRKNEQRSVIRAYQEYGMLDRAQKVKSCGTELIFAHSHGNDFRSLAHANFCRDPLCPLCAWRKSIKLREKVKYIYDHLESNGYNFLHITLTIENPRELSGSVSRLKGYFRKLSRSKWWKEKFQGYYSRIEVTWSEKGGWHPHIHILVATNTLVVPLEKSVYYQLSDELSSLWLDITCNSYITKISSGNFNEICKYVTKFSLFSERADLLMDLFSEISGRRLISRGGVFRSVCDELDVELTDDFDEGMVQFYEICKWDYATSTYHSEFLTPEEFRKRRYSYYKKEVFENAGSG